jgi:hypothetical protein
MAVANSLASEIARAWAASRCRTSSSIAPWIGAGMSDIDGIRKSATGSLQQNVCICWTCSIIYCICEFKFIYSRSY